MNAINLRVGKLFKASREIVGLDQQDIANVLEIPRTAVSQLESGQRDINLYEFDKLCRIYRVSPNEILGWNRTKPKDQKDDL